MKRLLRAVAIALGILSAAHGQTTTFHDAAERVTGKATTNVDGSTTYYDAADRVTGRRFASGADVPDMKDCCHGLSVSTNALPAPRSAAPATTCVAAITAMRRLTLIGTSANKRHLDPLRMSSLPR